MRLKKLIQVCLHAWKELKTNKVPQPNIRWIMNQEAVQDPHHHKEAFQKMFDELKEEFSEGELTTSLQDVLKLDSPSIATVPTMHSEATFVTNTQPEKFTRLSKANSFNETCTELTRTMLEQVSLEGKENLDVWLDMCLTIFQTIASFPSLTSLSDIKQISQKKKMSAWIQSRMETTFWNPDSKQKHDELRKEVWDDWHRTGLVSSQDQLLQNLRQLGESLSWPRLRLMNHIQVSD